MPSLEALQFVLKETLYGHDKDSTFIDDGTPALLTLLSSTPASKACLPVAGSSLAAQAQHVLFSLQAYYKAVIEDDPAYIVAGWPAWPNESDGQQSVFLTQDEWDALCRDLKKEADVFLNLLSQGAAFNQSQLRSALGCLAHTTYHFGVIQVKYDELLH